MKGFGLSAGLFVFTGVLYLLSGREMDYGACVASGILAVAELIRGKAL